MKEKNFYILVAGDGFDDVKHSAYEIAKSRIEKRYWPINKNTRNRKSIKSGDVCMFYISGRNENSQTIIGEAVVGEVLDIVVDECVNNEIEPSYSIYISSIKLSSIITLKDPMPIRPLLNNLSFISKNIEKWGSSFQGGCRRISKEDYLAIKESPCGVM